MKSDLFRLELRNISKIFSLRCSSMECFWLSLRGSEVVGFSCFERAAVS